MLQKFDNLEILTRAEINERYDGKLVGVLLNDEMFGQGLAYVAAVCEDTDEAFEELDAYMLSICGSYGLQFSIRAANFSEEEDLYVVISNVR